MDKYDLINEWWSNDVIEMIRSLEEHHVEGVVVHIVFNDGIATSGVYFDAETEGDAATWLNSIISELP